MGKGRNKKGRRRGDSSSDSSGDSADVAERPSVNAAKNSDRRSKHAEKDRLPANAFVTMDIDPARVRFAHSRVRPVFSGCARRLEDTLDDIRKGRVKPEQLPTITVIQGPSGADGPWYFSLNNRRLWVFKQAKREGLLDVIRVRVRGPKPHEAERYTVERCALEATLMRERLPSNDASDQDQGEENADGDAPDESQ